MDTVTIREQLSPGRTYQSPDGPFEVVEEIARWTTCRCRHLISVPLDQNGPITCRACGRTIDEQVEYVVYERQYAVRAVAPPAPNPANAEVGGYVIRLDQGDYYQGRGGYDWGRADRDGATVYETSAEARGEIDRCLAGDFAAASRIERIC